MSEQNFKNFPPSEASQWDINYLRSEHMLYKRNFHQIQRFIVFKYRYLADLRELSNSLVCGHRHLIYRNYQDALKDMKKIEHLKSIVKLLEIEIEIESRNKTL